MITKEMKTLQFLQVTPDELVSEILIEIRKELEELKKDFQPKEPVEYLTRNETSELLKVDLSTIHNWTRRGIIQSYGIGNRVYYKRSEIEEAIVAIKYNK